MPPILISPVCGKAAPPNMTLKAANAHSSDAFMELISSSIAWTKLSHDRLGQHGLHCLFVPFEPEPRSLRRYRAAVAQLHRLLQDRLNYVDVFQPKRSRGGRQQMHAQLRKGVPGQPNAVRFC